MECTCLHRRSSSSSTSASASSAVATAPPSTNLDIQSLIFDNRCQRLAEIETSLEHKLTLLDWTAQLTASSNNLGRKLSSKNSSTSDLYQILALFFVFEGVIITAVAQATAIKCRNSWLMFALSCIASAATFFACVQKLREIAEGKRIYLQEKDLCSALHSSIEQLKERGMQFDLAKGQPKLRWPHTNGADQSSASLGCPVQTHGFYKTWVWSYAGAVFLVLLAFSGVTLAAVRLIVCDPQRNS